MVVGVGERRSVHIQGLRLYHLAHHDYVGSHVQGGDHAAGKAGADAVRGIGVVQAVPSLGDAVELVGVAAALETEPLDLVHGHVVG